MNVKYAEENLWLIYQGSRSLVILNQDIQKHVRLSELSAFILKLRISDSRATVVYFVNFSAAGFLARWLVKFEYSFWIAEFRIIESVDEADFKCQFYKAVPNCITFL